MSSLKKRFQTLLLTLAMTVFVTVGMTAMAELTVRATDQDIVVLYTNDVHCGVDDNIGYAGLALYKKEMEAQTPYVALVDAGDAVQGAPIGTLSDGGYIIDIMNYVGYDFAIPGNHEFDYGMPRFLELSGKLNCGYYSCNFMNLTSGTPVFAPYKIVAYGDTQVAFVGVSTPESFTKSTPAYFQDGNGNYLFSFCEDGSGQALYNQVQAAVDGAKSQGAEVVILVGHLGNEGVSGQWTSEQIIKNTNGVDAVIDGHSHETYDKTYPNKDGEAVIVTQTGTKLKNIGKMTIKPDGTITTEMVTEVPGGVMATEDGKFVDAATDAYIKKIQAQYSESLKTVLGHTEVELTVKDPETGNRAVRSAETNLGDLCADAFRYQLGSDIGLMNGGGIRDNIAVGNITYNDTLKVFPFGNMGCVIEVTGQQIKDALEMAAKDCPQETGGFLHVSGITYTINTSVPSNVKLDERGNFKNVSGVYRVGDILVNGEPLDVNKTYTVASHNYMLKSGGDGMAMFAGSKVVKDDVMVDVDVLSSYISEKLGGNVGADYGNPKGQGRIIIK
ncbi:MAG: bifunctional metallophosphatase/5'-nucleotidase [Lachnospiraceae bacterium]|nr:bifunctional metallophosphatase/5'-nucleotidase [Lachnospiraceae bacterium]